MKFLHTPANLATHLHWPLRVRTFCQEHELPLRIIQAIVGFWLAIEAAKLIAGFVCNGAKSAFRLFS